MLAGGMYILAARPGMGKTTLALNIADRVAEKDRAGAVCLPGDGCGAAGGQAGLPAVRDPGQPPADGAAVRQDYTKMAEAAGKLEQIPCTSTGGRGPPWSRSRYWPAGCQG